MNPRHHPTDDILATYAAGALEPGFGLVVGAHAEGCAHCRAKVAGFEAASGSALKDLPEAEVEAGALARVMARFDEAPAPEAAPDTRPLLERLVLKPRKRVAPGVWVA